MNGEESADVDLSQEGYAGSISREQVFHYQLKC